MKAYHEPDGDQADDTRLRIIAAAADLILEGGPDAATTRAVAAAAGMQAPAIYRLFGDKSGLLDAVAEQVLADFMREKAQSASHLDAVADLRNGWDTYVAFGLANPALFTLMSASRAGPLTSAARAGLEILRQRVRRVVREGRLRVAEDQAADLIHAAGTGAILALLQKPEAERGWLAYAAREAVLNAILIDAEVTEDGAGKIAAIASALHAHLDNLEALTPGERLLLGELLQRLSTAALRHH